MEENAHVIVVNDPVENAAVYDAGGRIIVVDGDWRLRANMQDSKAAKAILQITLQNRTTLAEAAPVKRYAKRKHELAAGGAAAEADAMHVELVEKFWDADEEKWTKILPTRIGRYKTSANPRGHWVLTNRHSQDVLPKHLFGYNI